MTSLVLIADDEAALLDVLSTVVAELGHRPLLAHDGREALRLARAHHPDLIISDHMMPGLNGVELLRSIRADDGLKQTPFLLMSSARPKGADEADDFIPKPMTLEDMERTITQMLAHTRPRSAEEGEVLLPELRDPDTAQARAELLGWVAHELKSPLASARLNVELLLRDFTKPADEARRHRATAALRQIDRMSELMRSVLEMSQLAEGKITLQLVRVEARELLRQIVSDWREAQAAVTFALEVPPEEVWLEVDASRVRQVVDNLLSNAVKYRGTSSEVQVSLALSPGRAVISVRDFGVGIDAAELPRVFDRFHRAEGAPAEGHGLGLYIAASLAALHGGALSVKSEKGQGSTFSLALPRER